MPVVADVNSNSRKLRLKRRIPRIARSEIKLLPKPRRHLRDVMLAVFPQVFPIRINHRRGVVIQSGHLPLVYRNHYGHAIFLRQFLHVLDRRTVRHRLGQFVPARLLFGAKIWAIE